MPDDQKAGTGEGDPTATATAASGTTSVSSGQQETAEQVAERLKQENAELAKKLEDEHRLRLSHEQKVREANEFRRDEGRRAATDADPLDAEIADLEKAKATFDSQNAVDPATNSALRRAYAERDQRDRDAVAQRRIAQAKDEMSSVPEQYRDRTWQLFMSGRYYDVQSALQGAKGEETDKLREQLARRDADEKKREAEVLAAQASAPGSPRGGGSGGGGSSKKTMPLSQYVNQVQALQNTDPAAARKLTRDKDEGRIELDYTA